MLNEILIIILCLIVIITPSLQLFADFYYSFSTFILLIFTLLVILFLKINIKIKSILILVIMFIFKNNLLVIGKTFVNVYNAAYINTLSTRNDDSKLRDIVNNIYSPTLRIKTNFKKLPSYPSIIVCNYCNDRLENLSCILIPKNMAIMMRDGLKKTTKLHKLVKWPIFTQEKNSYDSTKKEIIEHVKNGRSIFTYITKYPRDIPNYIPKIRSGMFSIAKELDLPITLVAIDYIDIKFNIIQDQNFYIEIGDTFKVDNIQESIYKARKFYRDKLTKFINQKYMF
jgi:hypothetical protein